MSRSAQHQTREPGKPSRGRITLTKTERSSASGTELLTLLTGITADGRINDAEIAGLRNWLRGARTELEDSPAIAALRDVVEEALADGRVTPDERAEIVAIILRILPADVRGEASQNVAKAKTETSKLPPVIGKKPMPFPPKIRTEEPATAPQLAYLRALNVPVDETRISKWEASAAIDKALNSASAVSNRQMMVLRFWNKLEIAQRGKRGVSEWMDTWYAEDPLRIAAWELWKEAHGDCGKQANPSIVPIGAGFQWLKKAAGKNRFPTGKFIVGVILFWGIVAALYACTRMEALE